MINQEDNFNNDLENCDKKNKKKNIKTKKNIYIYSIKRLRMLR
jgi:hypothetical protein